MRPRDRKYFSVGCILLTFALRAYAGDAPFTASNPPIVAAATLLPSSLSPALDAYATSVNENLASALTVNPNVRLYERPRVLRDPAFAEVPYELETVASNCQYLITARLVASASGGAADVETRLFDLRTREMLGVRRFRSAPNDLPAFIEIELDALIGRIVQPYLGILWIRANEAPTDVTVTTGGELGPRVLPRNLFTLYPRSSGTGVEMLSRPLLPGEYTIEVTFAGLPAMTQRAQVEPQARRLVSFDTGRAPSPPVVAGPRRATLHLTGIAPEQAVYVTSSDDEGDFAASLYRPVGDALRIEWIAGKSVEDATLTTTRSEAVIGNLPPGNYTLRTWSGQVRTVGKTLFRGVGMEETVSLKGEDAPISLAVPKTATGPARLNLFWTPFGPPHGAALYVDDRYIGQVFDSGTVSVVGLPSGARVVRFEARGFRPVTLPVALRASRETTLFIQLERDATPAP